MSLTDELMQKCPNCSHEASLKELGTWEKDGKRGLLGKTKEGFIMFLCPECLKEMQYDPLTNNMLLSDEHSNNKLKKWSLIYALMTILGIIGNFIGLSIDNSSLLTLFPSIMFIIGILGFIITRILIWWRF